MTIGSMCEPEDVSPQCCSEPKIVIGRKVQASRRLELAATADSRKARQIGREVRKWTSPVCPESCELRTALIPSSTMIPFSNGLPIDQKYQLRGFCRSRYQQGRARTRMPS